MRVVVVEPPPPGHPRLGRAQVSVAAFDWVDPDPVATVVVKLTYGFGGEEVVLANEQQPIARDHLAATDADLRGEIHHPWDLAPYKPEADVLVVGHAHTADGKPRR